MPAAGINILLYQSQEEFIEIIGLHVCNRVNKGNSFLNVSLEKEMATHSGTLAWKIPWTEKPGRLQSMGSQRVRHS